MIRILLALVLALFALPANAAKPAKRGEAAAVTKTLGTWKVKCFAPAGEASRRCTLARGYLLPILQIDDKGVRLVDGDPKGACGDPWRYRVDGKDIAGVAAADRVRTVIAGHELTRARPM